jgi:hypothetical protein
VVPDALISFLSRAMEVADDEWEFVGRESHAVVQQVTDAAHVLRRPSTVARAVRASGPDQ